MEREQEVQYLGYFRLAMLPRPTTLNLMTPADTIDNNQPILDEMTINDSNF